MYGELDGKNKAHGRAILYFYPDVCTVIRGNYEHGILERGKNMQQTLRELNGNKKLFLGHLVYLNGIISQDGIMEPICNLYPEDKTNVFTYDQPSRFCISKNPFQR